MTVIDTIMKIILSKYINKYFTNISFFTFKSNIKLNKVDML